jgi:hypothetical protein
MPLVPRTLSVALFACLALATAGCGSNNTGKILGKWKLLSAPGLTPEEFKVLETFKAYPCLDFKQDGSIVAGPEFADPALKEFIAKGLDNQEMSKTGTYKLLSGDNVEITGIADVQKAGGLFGSSDSGRVKVTIEGDNMTITAENGTAQLTRVK